MRLPGLVSATVAVLLAAALSTSTISAQSDDVKATAAASVTTTAAASVDTNAAVKTKSFTVLKGVKAVPMTAKELNTVKGLHVHFVTPSKNTQWGLEGLQLAGDVKTENNWSNEWGGSDGVAVAPSYKGLCVATGLSGPGGSTIFIPGGQFQCPR